MKRSYKIGLTFGLTSGIITTLGLMVGLYSSTNSQQIVIAGILTIAIADSLSDSLGIHFTQESENHICKKEIWESTFCTLACKFVFSSIFIIPVLAFDLHTAIIISVMIGVYLIALISTAIARERGEKPLKVVLEHVAISLIVVFLSNFIGNIIEAFF